MKEVTLDIDMFKKEKDYWDIVWEMTGRDYSHDEDVACGTIVLHTEDFDL